jgi:hypothetical protein
MCPNLELLTGLLINMGRSIYRESFNPGRQRYRASNTASCLTHGLDNLLHGLVQKAMIIGLKADSDLFVHQDNATSDQALSSNVQLLNDFGDDTRTNGSSSLTDGEP